MGFADQTETLPAERYVKARLEGDPHIWKVCSWPQDMRNTKVGTKSERDAVGSLRDVPGGRRHRRQATRTPTRAADLTADAALAIDPTAVTRSLCARAGKHFFFDSSVGGVGLRPVGSGMPHWASAYSEATALVHRVPRRRRSEEARGYFKNVNDVVIDPLRAAETSFTITSSLP